VRTQQWLKRLGNVLMASIAVTDFEKESLNRDLLTAIVVVSDEIWKNWVILGRKQSLNIFMPDRKITARIEGRKKPKAGQLVSYKAAEFRVRRPIKDKCALKENLNYIKVLTIRDLGTNASCIWP